MTLDEAIRHAEEVADYDCYSDEQKRCADEHRQLAEWLRELKRFREMQADGDSISRQAAIDAINALLPAAEPVEVYCPMASRACFANGKKVAWCLTCPYISEEDRELVKKAVKGSQPKTGRWIYQFRDSENEEYKCSECDYPTAAKHNYCPNCGAKMVREDGEA